MRYPRSPIYFQTELAILSANLSDEAEMGACQLFSKF